jgi:hypothetical protein
MVTHVEVPGVQTWTVVNATFADGLPLLATEGGPASTISGATLTALPPRGVPPILTSANLTVPKKKLLSRN